MKYFLVAISVFLLACSSNISASRKQELWKMMQSEKVDSIIWAIEEIEKSRDTSMIEAVLYHANDPRITHRLSHKGKSVFQIKMEALKKITGILPPVEITYEVDTNII